MLSALYGLQTFTDKSRKISVRIFLDNSTAVAYINKCGDTRSHSMTAIAAQIVAWCEARSISLSASHIPGSLNSIADKESRSLPDANDWMLFTEAFKLLLDLGSMEMDLFVAAWNAQLPKFAS